METNWDLLLTHSNLIYKLAIQAEWTEIEKEERMGMAWVWATDIYVNNFDPSKGKLSTILTISIRNKFIKEWEKLSPRKKRTENILDDFERVSEQAICPERRALLVDGLSRLSKDAKLLVWLLLHPSKKVVKKIQLKKNDNQFTRYTTEDLGWSCYRVKRALEEIKEVIYS